MRFPLSLTTQHGRLHGPARSSPAQERFPLVLMLEPLHACNLTCTGCGRIREYAPTIKEKLTRRGVPGRRRRGRRSDRQHLRRRADDLSRNRRARQRDPQDAASTSISAPTACSSRRSCTSSGRPVAFFFNVHLDGLEEDARPGRGARGRLRRRRRGHQGGQEGRLPGLHQHDRLQGNRHGRDRSPCSPT